MLALALAACASMAAQTALTRALAPGVLPAVGPRHAFASLFDLTPVPLTITEDWQSVSLVRPAYLVGSDETLWRKMQFQDWDTVPSPVREAALAALVARSRWVMAGPEVWRGLLPEDWDAVPQPMRAMAFIEMARYWADRAGLGAEYEVSVRRAGDTLAAILMAESWFEHRAAYTNPDGTIDLGLGGASAYCRRTLRRLKVAGVVSFAPDDAEFFNPWVAVHAAAEWLALELDEAGGDLGLAVRAYHVGIAAAKAGGGADYLASVELKRHRFIENAGAPPSWRFVYGRVLPHATAAAMRLAAALRPDTQAPSAAAAPAP